MIPQNKQKEICPRVKFDFEPLNLKRTQWAPKMGKNPSIKFEFGAQRWAKAPTSN
jgi:hypothetical protein